MPVGRRASGFVLVAKWRVMFGDRTGPNAPRAMRQSLMADLERAPIVWRLCRAQQAVVLRSSAPLGLEVTLSKGSA
jgi:hypothetical protein